MTVNSIQEAWKEVDRIFPTDYEKDQASSQRAGYAIYRSTAEGHHYDYICDLNDRLEINLSSGKSINVWIKREPVNLHEIKLLIDNCAAKCREIERQLEFLM